MENSGNYATRIIQKIERKIKIELLEYFNSSHCISKHDVNRTELVSTFHGPNVSILKEKGFQAKSSRHSVKTLVFHRQNVLPS